MHGRRQRARSRPGQGVLICKSRIGAGFPHQPGIFPYSSVIPDAWNHLPLKLSYLMQTCQVFRLYNAPESTLTISGAPLPGKKQSSLTNQNRNEAAA